MPLVLDGTNGVSGVDGTASNPAIEGTDSNTGIFYPAADTVAIGTGGTEALRVTSAQNVGIGTSSPSAKLTVASGAIRMSDGFEIGWGDNSTFIAGNGSSDVLQFATAAAERMRLDSSGNLGLGVTPSAWGTYKALQVGGAGYGLMGGTSATVFGSMVTNAYFDGSVWKYVNSSFAQRYDTASGEHRWFTAPSGTAGNTITWTQAMTLDASGVLLVGTTAKGTYGGNTAEFRGANLATLGGNDTGNFSIFTTDSQAADRGAVISLGGVYSGTTPYAFGAIAARKLNSTSGNAQGYLQFYTTSSGNGITEKARITSDGDTLFNTTTAGITNSLSTTIETSAANNSRITVNHSSVAGSSNDSNFMQFGYGGNLIGRIVQASTTSVSYTTTSDYRLKENVQPMTGALEKIAALKPCTYTWKSSGETSQGFLAHELQAVVPECVTGEKDAVETYIDEEGSEQTRPAYQGIDTSFLVATLTAAIQEQQAMIDELKAKVAALEGAA